MSVSRSLARARFDVERERDKRKAWNFPGYQDRQQFRAELDCEIVDGEGLRWSPLSEATRDIASVVFFFFFLSQREISRSSGFGFYVG